MRIKIEQKFKDLSNEDMDDYGFKSRTELVNERLAQFYNACDYVGCWIGL